MQFSRKLLIAGYRFPVVETVPSSYTTQRVVTVPNSQYVVYTVPEDGWYKLSVCGTNGGGAASGGPQIGGIGGRVDQIIYLYQGQKCLMWNGGSSQGQVCPGGGGYALGGLGGYGHDESGAAGAGGWTAPGAKPHWEGGTGGASSGLIAGFTDILLESDPLTAGSLTRPINYEMDFSVVKFKSITTYAIGAGGGGAASDNGDHRCGGAGGGALGNGGNVPEWPQAYGTSGPAGAWGRGADGLRYSNGGNGAWGMIDFSRRRTPWGQGGGYAGNSSPGWANLDRVIPD